MGASQVPSLCPQEAGGSARGVGLGLRGGSSWATSSGLGTFGSAPRPSCTWAGAAVPRGWLGILFLLCVCSFYVFTVNTQ